MVIDIICPISFPMRLCLCRFVSLTSTDFLYYFNVATNAVMCQYSTMPSIHRICAGVLLAETHRCLLSRIFTARIGLGEG